MYYTPTPDYYNDILKHGMQERSEDTLVHYGVLGMKWKKHKAAKARKKAHKKYVANKIADDMETGRANTFSGKIDTQRYLFNKYNLEGRVSDIHKMSSHIDNNVKEVIDNGKYAAEKTSQNVISKAAKVKDVNKAINERTKKRKKN